VSAKTTQLLIEAAYLADARAVATRYAVEVAVQFTAPSPTAPTGAGVTRDAVEVAYLADSVVRATSYAVEIAYLADALTTAASGGPAQSSYGISE
jgi:hypothetical protein